MTDMQIKARSSGASDDTVYWRSFDQLADTPEFREILHREFPEGAAEHSGLDDPVSRRRFLGVVAASVALAGMTSCRKPGREILAYTSRPGGLVPGVPQHYATAFDRFGYGVGVLVRSNDGRPTKVEGNPEHPSSRGATDSFVQAEVLNLYDPARSKHVREGGAAPEAGDHGAGHDGPAAHPSLAEFRGFWSANAMRLAEGDGEGLRVLMAPSSSPTQQRMVEEVLSALPKARFQTWSPLIRDAEITGAKLAFGQAHDTHYDFSKAEVVAAFDSDFLGVDAPTMAWTRTWAESRRIENRDGAVSRLYVAEPTYTLTGSNADHRFRLSGSEVGDAVLALAAELGVGGDAMKSALATVARVEFKDKAGKDWITALARDLRARAGKACVVVGPNQPAAIHAVGHAINAALGAVGPDKPVTYTPTPAGLQRGQDLAALRELTASIEAGAVDTLICLGTNPVYDAPADLGFAAAYARVPNRVHCGLWVDETALASTWHVPLTHPLEEWGDILGYDGTASIVQPLIAPLYPDARSAVEMLSDLLSEPADGYDLVQGTWRERKPSGVSFDEFWKRTLHEGVAAGTAAPVVMPALDTASVAAGLQGRSIATRPSAGAFEIGFRACPTVLDGRYSNNPWQQELPSPIEKLVWDNAVLMSRATAQALGVYNHSVVAVTVGDRTVEGPVWIQPGHAENCATIWLGYGRRMATECEVARDRGFDVYKLRGSDAPWYASGATIEPAGRDHTLVSSQEHGVMEGRPLVRENDLATFQAGEWSAEDDSPLAKAAKLQGKREGDLLKSLWEERDYSQGYQWGMVIDLNTCSGCNACVSACVSENNIPMVGKDQIARGREMSWNRMDRYFTGTATQDGVAEDDEPQVVHQMVPCMQCENAPCESVCPVGATTHSPEGLNDMAYNRCVGTRYCSNNCPYKVRRFNWFNFNKDHPPQRQMAFNPDVTVRARGVMEKCTYCVQRINAGKLAAKLDDRTVRDGEIKTACQQVCPAEAISFGNIRDESARVTQLKQSPLNYAMLSELNVKPRTTYLAKIRNPNPELS